MDKSVASKKEYRLPAFRDRLNTLRGDLSYEEFATRLELSRATIGFYLAGQRVPDAVVLKNIATTFNVSVDWLLGLSDISTSNPDARTACAYTGLSEKSVALLHQEAEEPVRDFQVRGKSGLLYFYNHLMEYPNQKEFGGEICELLVQHELLAERVTRSNAEIDERFDTAEKMTPDEAEYFLNEIYSKISESVDDAAVYVSKKCGDQYVVAPARIVLMNTERSFLDNCIDALKNVFELGKCD